MKEEKKFFVICLTSVVLQHFHNKSQVVNCYRFKFKFSTEIAFLTQQ